MVKSLAISEMSCSSERSRESRRKVPDARSRITAARLSNGTEHVRSLARISVVTAGSQFQIFPRPFEDRWCHTAEGHGNPNTDNLGVKWKGQLEFEALHLLIYLFHNGPIWISGWLLDLSSNLIFLSSPDYTSKAGFTLYGFSAQFCCQKSHMVKEFFLECITW